VVAKKPFEREDRLEQRARPNPKERVREAKRVARKRELEMMKNDYKEKSGLSEDPVISETWGLDLISLGSSTVK
jgi:hypothetical protein